MDISEEILDLLRENARFSVEDISAMKIGRAHV